MLSAKALADLLDVDAKTVRRWREEGRLPEPIQIGGVIRWRAEDIDDWLGGGR
jgi:excisionase family DNA binding protein